jgi:hypothetical protein
MLCHMTQYSNDPHLKPVSNCGDFAYLVRFARQYLATYGGYIEIRSSVGVLRYAAFSDEDEQVQETFFEQQEVTCV